MYSLINFEQTSVSYMSNNDAKKRIFGLNTGYFDIAD